MDCALWLLVYRVILERGLETSEIPLPLALNVLLKWKVHQSPHTQRLCVLLMLIACYIPIAITSGQGHMGWPLPVATDTLEISLLAKHLMKFCISTRSTESKLALFISVHFSFHFNVVTTPCLRFN